MSITFIVASNNQVTNIYSNGDKSTRLIKWYNYHGFGIRIKLAIFEKTAKAWVKLEASVAHHTQKFGLVLLENKASVL